jgi:diaminopimelate decarboxylase
MPPTRNGGTLVMTTDFNETARRLRNAVEPVAAGVYFALKANAAYQALRFGGSPITQDSVARPR